MASSSGLRGLGFGLPNLESHPGFGFRVWGWGAGFGIRV